ncbi:MAG: efflux RND transporter periplasmic adaptor subunit [Chitinophagaceae bacterium]|nr:efflux RND transporter periplasmic adaptor subunit [Chitinophagaceae bacterium]
MRNMFKTGSIVMLTILLAACGSSTKEEKGALNDKKVQLEKLKTDQKKLGADIVALENEIAKLDTSAGVKEKEKLVTLSVIEPGKFTHYIDLQGRVDAENIAYVTPRGMGGMVTGIYVKQGQQVSKGQLLLRLDNAVEQKQIEQLQTQLSYAKDIYQRQQNLWNQNIGTEVQVLTAKNNVETLEKQIATSRQSLSNANVYAQISGVADEVNIKVGETFSPQTAAMTGIRIVNTNDLKIVAAVPENYLGRVGVGTNLLITLPEQNNDTLRSKVNVAGKIIDPNTRAFNIEAKIPSGKKLKPNQLAMVKIQDYASSAAISIPVNTLQNDDKGKFVMVAVKENGKMIARKRPINIGELYGDRLEVKSGLQSGDTLIIEGFQGLYDGQLITTSQA